jgi:hypothetical protein
MSREKILNTAPSSEAALKLKEIMLAYHDFQPKLGLDIPLSKLAQWQSERLKHTHQDLYASPNYQRGLAFLFTDLYSTEDFSNRDRDLERIFPKMIKLLPSSIIETVSLLVELNLLTQKLDLQLAEALFETLKASHIDEASYCEAYRLCDNHGQRAYQIQLTYALGKKLDKYARSSIINFSLKVTEGPAEMAGLSALHHFLMSGFSAFHSMRNIKPLMKTLTDRESVILDKIYNAHAKPLQFDLSI